MMMLLENVFFLNVDKDYLLRKLLFALGRMCVCVGMCVKLLTQEERNRDKRTRGRMRTLMFFFH